MVNRILLGVLTLFPPQVRLVHLEQPVLLVLDLALLDALQCLEELDANGTGLAGGVLVSELLALGFVCNRLDRNKSRRGTSSEDFLEFTEFRVRDLTN
jgi:hypothetical protein